MALSAQQIENIHAYRYMYASFTKLFGVRSANWNRKPRCTQSKVSKRRRWRAAKVRRLLVLRKKLQKVLHIARGVAAACETKRVCVLDHVEFVSVALVATKLRHSVLQRLVSRWTNEKVKEIPTKKKKKNKHTRPHTKHTPAPIQKQIHAQGVCCAALAAADEDDHQIQSQRQRQTDINGSSL